MASNGVPEYVRGVVLEFGHVEVDGASTTDVSWGKTREDSLVLTPGSVSREFLYTGQDLAAVDSQRVRLENATLHFRMAQGDPTTIARSLGLPDNAVDDDKLTVKQTEIGEREFHLYALVETSVGIRRLDIPRAVVTDTDELNFTKGDWAAPGSTMTILQKAGEDALWAWDKHTPGG